MLNFLVVVKGAEIFSIQKKSGCVKGEIYAEKI